MNAKIVIISSDKVTFKSVKFETLKQAKKQAKAIVKTCQKSFDVARLIIGNKVYYMSEKTHNDFIEF